MFYGMNGYRSFLGMHGFSYGGIIMGIVLLAVIVLLVVLVMRSSRFNKTGSTHSENKGLDILVERFARGEIDGATFRSMKAELFPVDNSGKK